MTDNSKNDEQDYELNAAIIREYENNGSIAGVAKKLHTTKVKVQRVLITEGLWSSKRTRQIEELRKQGHTVEKIAEMLGKDVKTIQTFLPYSRGQYGVRETGDSVRSKEYRKRIHSAAESMALKESDSMGEIIMFDTGNTKTAAENGKNCHSTIHPENDTKKDYLSGNGVVFRLKLELTDHFLYGANKDLGMKPKERAEFLNLAKAKEGISREVLVPGTMNLHGMHYMIQRLFGWQNSHLHHFSISEKEFDGLTGGTVGGWTNLCGSLLHFPTDDFPDLYWDDDYKENMSVKSWFKRKYIGPYIHKAVCDTYYDTGLEVDDFLKHFPDFTADMALDEMNRRVIMEETLNSLNERLTLEELLLKGAPHTEKERKKVCSEWLKNLAGSREETDRLIDKISRRKLEELDEACEGLKRWRTNRSRLEQSIYRGMADDIEEQTGYSLQEWMYDVNYFIPRFERTCKILFAEYNPRLTPLFDTLYYEYDYGDGWCVKITVLDRYDKMANAGETVAGPTDVGEAASDPAEVGRTASDLTKFGVTASDLAEVAARQRPMCISADGLYLVDDVGGIYGFYEMLKTLAGDDEDEKKYIKTWARGMGWNGRMNKPEKML